MKRFGLVALVALVALLSFSAFAVPLGAPLPSDEAVSVAAAVPIQMPAESIVAPVPQPDDIAAFAGAILSAFQARNYGLLAAFALILIVWAGRKFGAKAWPFLGTDRGGVLLSLVGGLGLSIAAAATAPGATSIGAVLLAGLLMTVTASGTYSALRKLLFPTGANTAQEIAVDAKAVEVKAQTSAQAAAESLNKVLGR